MPKFYRVSTSGPEHNWIFLLIEVKLIYSVVLVSGVKQGDSVFLCVCVGGVVCVFFFRFFST